MTTDIREVLEYERSSGVFRWKTWRGGSAKAGAVAGSIDSKGYVQIRIGKRLYLAHRLAWWFEHGAFPCGHLDHIDRNPRNNAISNLRECTHAQNHQNTGVRADNSSGVTGVSFNRVGGKWLAYINVQGTRHRLGLFASKDDAIAARLAAKSRLHTFHSEQRA